MLDPIPWLLDARTPSIRYLTLRRLLGRPEQDAEVQVVRQEMATRGPIPTILSGQTPAGNWSGERGYYTPKYVSTHWSMLLLAELAADVADPRLQRGAAFMLQATEAELHQALARGEQGMSCFWGNLLRYTLHSGQGGDPPLGAIVQYLAHDALAAGWRCPINDGLACAWGAARGVWGLAALPASQRSQEVETAIQSGVAFLLEAGRLAQGDYPTPGHIHSLWSRLNFPLFYQADILFVLRVLAEVGALAHPGAGAGLEWLAARRRPYGRWRGASPFRRRTWPELADREETDRWVTLHASIVLQSG